MKRVFVSSTFADLALYRQQVRDAIRQLGAVDIAMEHFGARDNRPKDECIRLIAEESDVFVGLYAHRYGHIPDGDSISITEAEYAAATAAGRTRFIYLLDENTPWLPSHIDKDEAARGLRALKARLTAAHVCKFFSNEHQLAAQVAADLGRYFAEGAPAGAEGHRGVLHQPTPEWRSPIANNAWRYKVVAFDLDGTLLRGGDFRFSWEAVWNGLGFSREIQAELKREYRSKAQDRHNDAERIHAYREWCQEACIHFKARRLTRRHLSDLIGPLRLTNNCTQALATLRREGFVLAVISGGINCFLEEKLPDFRNYFDFVFINELKFDAEGLLSEVVATEFDFEGKAKGLTSVCDRAGCTHDEAVFVGDRFNDEAVMLAAGKSIAYPPTGDPVDGICDAVIREDNLELVVREVCVR